MSIAKATAPSVVGAYKNPVNSRGGYFPREDFPWWPVPAGSCSVVGGSLYKKYREFRWCLDPAGRVPVEASSRPKKSVNSRDD